MPERKIFNKSLCDSDKCAVSLIRCPLYPRKRTCRPILFDHFLGAGEQRFRNRNGERFGGLQVDVQIKLGGLLHR